MPQICNNSWIMILLYFTFYIFVLMLLNCFSIPKKFMNLEESMLMIKYMFIL